MGLLSMWLPFQCCIASIHHRRISRDMACQVRTAIVTVFVGSNSTLVQDRFWKFEKGSFPLFNLSNSTTHKYATIGIVCILHFRCSMTRRFDVEFCRWYSRRKLYYFLYVCQSNKKGDFHHYIFSPVIMPIWLIPIISLKMEYMLKNQQSRLDPIFWSYATDINFMWSQICIIRFYIKRWSTLYAYFICKSNERWENIQKYVMFKKAIILMIKKIYKHNLQILSKATSTGRWSWHWYNKTLPIISKIQTKLSN